VLDTINVAASGLAVSREQVENVMNNIANENTPGYKKRVVGVSEAPHIDSRLTGRGALVGDTTRITNTYIYDNLVSQKSKQSQYNELSAMLTDIEAIFYETDDSGFSADMDKYFQSIENLRANPYNEIYKNNLRNAGTAIVDDLKTLYFNIEQREVVTKNSISTHISSLNSFLINIGEVNKILSNSDKLSNDLLDKRDKLEQDISKYVDINVYRANDYELQITNLTAVRFDNNIHEVKLVINNIPQKDVYANDSNPSKSNLVDISSWEDIGDKVIYRLNNTTSISVAYGDYVTNTNGNRVDLNADGEINDFDRVDKNNVVKALVYKINHTPGITSLVTAYNGQYYTDKNGNKILTNDINHPDYDSNHPNKDRYLIIESNINGDVGKFSGRIIVEDADAAVSTLNLDKNTNLSVKGTDDVHLEIFDKTLTLKSGKLKSLIDNLNSTSSNNLFIQYKEKLDNLAKALSNMTGSFIQNIDGTYVSGNKNVDIDTNRAKRIDIGLFSGSTVNSLKFNDKIISSLSQTKLDYLSSLQWKTDIDIDGTGSNLISFSKYSQALRVQVSEDKENIDSKKSIQDAVISSLQLGYDKLTKVNKDEELMNLVKFQAAYQANAKMITVVDEMLQTILGMKR
jgi:flagellar hook-associated protein 1 FlgK